MGEREHRVVAAVIPTVDRCERLPPLLAAVAAQTHRPDATIVVDAGSRDATPQLLRSRPDLVTVRRPVPEGAAAGFEHGIRAAEGADWIWLLDDDCEPAPGALAALLAESSAPSVGAVAPTVDFGDGHRQAGWRVGERTASGRGQEPQDPAAGPADVDWGAFSGLLLSTVAWREVGGLRTDFLLWYADLELGLRLRAAGWRVRSAPAAIVRHPPMSLTTRRVLGRTFAVAATAPWREYDEVRNVLALRRAVRNTPWDFHDRLLRRSLLEALRWGAILLADPRGPARLRARARAWCDHRLGRPLSPEARPARYVAPGARAPGAPSAPEAAP